MIVEAEEDLWSPIPTSITLAPKSIQEWQD
jgi:hypothetical protein